MPLMLLVISLHLLGPWECLINFSSHISLPLHELCLSLVPINSPYNELNSSLICGSPLYNSAHFKSVLTLGAVHLFVVSGFHIHCIQTGLKYLFPSSLKTKQIWISTLLFLYGATCLFHPPVLRALIHMHIPNKKYMPNSLTSAVSGLVVLTLNPSLWTSLSLQMSWLANLIFTSPALKLRHKLILTYLGSILLLSPNDFAHPITLVLSLPLGLFIGFIMIPLNMLSLAYTESTWLLDKIWFNFMHLANLVNQNFQLFTSSSQLSPAQKWTLIITSNMALYYWEVYKKRRNYWA